MAINPYDKWPKLDIKPLDFGQLMQAQQYINQAQEAKLNRDLKAYEDLSKLKTTHIQQIPGSIDEARQQAVETEQRKALEGYTDQYAKGKMSYKDLMLGVMDSRNKIASSEAVLGNENYKSWAESQKTLNDMKSKPNSGYNPVFHASFLDAKDFDSAAGHRWTKSPEAFQDPLITESLYNNMTALEDPKTGASFITPEMVQAQTEKNLPLIMTYPFTQQQISIARSKGDKRPDEDIAREIWNSRGLEYIQQKYPTKTTSTITNTDATTSPATNNIPAYVTSTVQTAIIPDDEAAKSQQSTIASSYKSNDPKFIQDQVTSLAASLPSLKYVDPNSLKINRTVDPKENKINYSIGITEDEYVNKFPANQQTSARTDYKLIVNSLNNQGIQEQHLANLHTQAVKNVTNGILGDPASSPVAKALHNYVDAVENYGTLNPAIKAPLDAQINALKDGYLKNKVTQMVAGSPSLAEDLSEERMRNYDRFYAEKEQELNSALRSGKIPQDFKSILYEEMANRSSNHRPLKRFAEFINPENDEIAKEYASLYQKDQSKNYNVVTFSPETTTKEKWNDLQKYQYELTQGLLGSDQGTAAGVRGATFYITGSFGVDGLPVGEYNSQELFGPKGTEAQATGVRSQGFIYDKENGWFLKGVLQGAGLGEEVLVKVPGMDERIINNLTANPDAAHFTGLIGTLLQAMPNNEIDSSKDFKVAKIFSKFGMSDVYITGGENMGGYRISYKPEPDVAETIRKTNPNILDANGYLYNEFPGLQDLGNFVSVYTKNFGTGKK